MTDQADHRPVVLFLGDSLIEHGPWAHALPEYRTVNQGAGGDTALGVHSRLRHALTVPDLGGGPDAVVLMIGTNDLTLKVPVPEIADGVGAILADLATRATEAHLVVNSVPPRTARMRGKLRALNEAVRAVTAEQGGDFVDLWPVLADEDGRLRADLTPDKLHLNDAGYEAWISVLRPALRARLGA